ncbi:transposase family protein [Amycolatopsis sp. FBCC-B4732]|uniref:transposase family protein n=1 Tax=Amycolatopsis sp. FBCC-B4732 TaxID=3079339 RepID=UPI001FF5091F|nr:transposase family protein [Amycolatopsis sp. FBCC-B4732]UOX92076.1 transposase family protein [Amycolatopsis sp. FBCC-B4732]
MVAESIRRHRGRLRSRWRKATPAGQALAVLRHDPRLADLGGGTGVSASTVRRRVLKVIALLAARCGQAALPTSPPPAGCGSGNVSTPGA